MSRDVALGLVRDLVAAAHRRDVSHISRLYADDAVAVSPVFGEVRGRAGIAATWQMLVSVFADVAVEISDVLVDGDRVAVLSSITTSDWSAWVGRPAGGGPISYRLVLLLTIRDGRIIRDERIYDSTGVLERLEKARLDKELQTAADTQRALLSRTAHLGRFCESVGDSEPCRAIGGDFFEFVELPSGDVGIMLGDVSGKGPSAALLAALLQGMFVVDVARADSPSVTLARINRRLAARNLDSRFATLVYAVLSPDGRLVYSNAGHNPPVLLRDGGVRRLSVGGPIAGAFPDAVFEEESLCMAGRDTLVMFTDGVTEARSASNEEFGEDRLIACLRAEAVSPPDVLLKRVFAAVREFCLHADQSDDITLTVTRLR